MLTSPIIPLLAVLFPASTLALGPTNIFIDTLAAYSSLEPCARNRMSAIVRAQSSGCGDQQQTTSFACFCFASSAGFDAIISTAVETQCASTSPTAQASSALEVFKEYCAQGEQLRTTVFTTPTSSPTSAQTASSAGPTDTSMPSSHSGSDFLSGGAIAGIVVGVIAGVAVIIAAGLLVWRRRKQGAQKARFVESPAEMPTSSDAREIESKDIKEADAVKKPPVEVGDGAPEGRAELPAPNYRAD